MKKMTAGILFWGTQCLLVEKNRPKWQDGLLNLIGGHVEENETPFDCMRREFMEETKLSISDWDLFAIETGPATDPYMVYFYRASLPYPDQNSRAMAISVPSLNDSDEKLHWLNVADLPMRRVVGNLHWLIPMAQDWRRLVAKIDTSSDIRERASW